LISDLGANPFGPPQTSRDKAKAAIEQEKTKKVIDDIVARHPSVKVAENYQVKPPEPQQPMQGLPFGQPGQPGHPGSEPPPAAAEKPSPAAPAKKNQPKPKKP
jgi:hypothetical protein